MKSVYVRLGHKAMLNDWADLGTEIMPQYDLCEDWSQNGEMFHNLEEEPETSPELKD